MVTIHKLGDSVQGVPLQAELLGQTGPILQLHSGLHGDEPEAIDFLTLFWKEVLASPPTKLSLLYYPLINPDGLKKGTRGNANGVDLNRNFPSSDWSPESSQKKNYPGTRAASEPETRAVMAAIERFSPVAIISIHTWVPQVNFDGPGKQIAKCMAEKNGYPVTEDIGYPTPGSLGSFAGRDRNIPVITLELPEHVPALASWSENAAALWAAINYLELYVERKNTARVE